MHLYYWFKYYISARIKCTIQKRTSVTSRICLLDDLNVQGRKVDEQSRDVSSSLIQLQSLRRKHTIGYKRVQ